MKVRKTLGLIYIKDKIYTTLHPTSDFIYRQLATFPSQLSCSFLNLDSILEHEDTS